MFSCKRFCGKEKKDCYRGIKKEALPGADQKTAQASEQGSTGEKIQPRFTRCERISCLEDRAESIIIVPEVETQERDEKQEKDKTISSYISKRFGYP